MWAGTSEARSTAGDPMKALIACFPSEKWNARAFCSQTRYWPPSPAGQA